MLWQHCVTQSQRALNAEVTNECEEFEQKMDSQIGAEPNPLALIHIWLFLSSFDSSSIC